MSYRQNFFSPLLVVAIVLQLSPLLAQSIGDQCDFEILPPNLPITVSKLGANWTVTSVYFVLDISYVVDPLIGFDIPIERNFWAVGDIFEIGYTDNSFTYNEKIVVQPDGGFNMSALARECFVSNETKNIRIFTSSSFSVKYTSNSNSCKPRRVQGNYVAGPCDVSIALDRNSEPNIISFPLLSDDGAFIDYPCITSCRFDLHLADSNFSFIGLTLRVSDMLNGSDFVSIISSDTDKIIQFSGYFNSTSNSMIDLGTFGGTVEVHFANVEYRQSYMELGYSVRTTASDGECDSHNNADFFCRSYNVAKKQSATKATTKHLHRSTTKSNSLSAAIFDEKNFTCAEGSCSNSGSVSSRSHKDSTCICDTGFTGRFCDYEMGSYVNDSIGFMNIQSGSCAITDSLTYESNVMVIQSWESVKSVSVSYIQPSGRLSLDNYTAIQSIACLLDTIPTVFEYSIGPLPPCNVSTVYIFELNEYIGYSSTRENGFAKKVIFTCMSLPRSTETSYQTSSTAFTPTAPPPTDVPSIPTESTSTYPTESTSTPTESTSTYPTESSSTPTESTSTYPTESTSTPTEWTSTYPTESSSTPTEWTSTYATESSSTPTESTSTYATESSSTPTESTSTYPTESTSTPTTTAPSTTTPSTTAESTTVPTTTTVLITSTPSTTTELPSTTTPSTTTTTTTVPITSTPSTTTELPSTTTPSTTTTTTTVPITSTPSTTTELPSTTTPPTTAESTTVPITSTPSTKSTTTTTTVPITSTPSTTTELPSTTTPPTTAESTTVPITSTLSTKSTTTTTTVPITSTPSTTTELPSTTTPSTTTTTTTVPITSTPSTTTELPSTTTPPTTAESTTVPITSTPFTTSTTTTTPSTTTESTTVPITSTPFTTSTTTTTPSTTAESTTVPITSTPFTTSTTTTTPSTTTESTTVPITSTPSTTSTTTTTPSTTTESTTVPITSTPSTTSTTTTTPSTTTESTTVPITSTPSTTSTTTTTPSTTTESTTVPITSTPSTTSTTTPSTTTESTTVPITSTPSTTSTTTTTPSTTTESTTVPITSTPSTTSTTTPSTTTESTTVPITSTPSTTSTSTPSTTTESTTVSTTATAASTTTTSEWQTTTFVTHDDTDLGKLKNNVTADNVEEVLTNVTNILTQLNDSVSELNVTDSTEALLAAASIPGISTQAGVSFDQTIDLLVERGSDKFTDKSSDNLLTAIKQYDKNVNLTIGQSSNNSGNSFVHFVNFVDCRQPHFQVGLVEIDNGQNSIVNSIFNTEWESHQNGSHSDTVAMITITPSVICADTKSSAATKVSFRHIRNPSTVYVPTSKMVDDDTTTDTYCRSNRFPSIQVLGSEIVKHVGTRADVPMSVQIQFRKTLRGTQKTFRRNFKHNCGYWGSSGWITDDTNISLVSISGDNYKFNSTHLTDFSLIGSNNPKDKIFCQSGLSVLGTVGCILSVVSLFILTLFLLAIRLYVDSQAVALFSHIFIGFLAVFFFFFALFSDQTAVAIDDSVCLAFAAVNYFLLLSTMFLTCGQAVLTFRQFFNVVKEKVQEEITEQPRRIRITEETVSKLYAFVSAVIPALIVIFASLSKTFLVRSDFFCWINPADANLAVVIPIAIMLVFTISLTSFGLIMQNRSNRGSISGRHQSFKRAIADLKKKTKKIFGLQVILGLPWVFLFLTEIPDTTAFHYIFTITNAFQGVWVSAAYLLIEHRKEMRKLITLIRAKFPSKSTPRRTAPTNLISDESERRTRSDIVIPNPTIESNC